MQLPYLKENRKQFIEVLELFFWLDEIRSHFVKKSEKIYPNNSAVDDFLDAFERYNIRQYFKVRDSITILSDHVFWHRRKFYLEIMEKFGSEELTGEEFVDNFPYTLLQDNADADFLHKDSKKQETLELTRKSYRFSKIISDFYFDLEAFDPEPGPDDSHFLTENQLRQIMKKILPRVKKYFVEE